MERLISLDSFSAQQEFRGSPDRLLRVRSGMLHCEQTVKESFRPEVLQIKSPSGLALMTSFDSEEVGDGPAKNRAYRTEP